MAIELPDDLYQVLKEIAVRLGRTPEEMGGEWLTAAVTRVMSDPLLALAGTLECHVTDVGERHNEYIGQALLAEVRGHKDA